MTSTCGDFCGDTKVVSKVSTITNTNNLQLDLNRIITWSANNNMALNKNKFELMTHKLTTDNSNLKLLKNLPFFNEFTSYSISNQINLTPSTSVKDLGIHIDTKLSWDHHIVELTRQSRQICGWILSVFYSREKCLMLTLFKSLVRSKMEYCCEIFDPYLIKNINSLEQIQRSFTN